MKLSEKEREVDVLHHRLVHVESELDRQRKKVQSLRDNMKSKGYNAVEERRLADNAIEVLSSELRVAKQDLGDSIARERQVTTPTKKRLFFLYGLSIKSAFLS